MAAIATLTATFAVSFALIIRILTLALLGRVHADLLAATFAYRPRGLPLWLTVGVPVCATVVVFGGLVALDRWRRGLAARRFEAGLDDPPATTEQTLTRLAQSANVPAPELRVLNADVPTAFTTGLRVGSARITVTTGLLQTLDNDQLRAVLAHELSHLKNRDVNVMTAAMAPIIIAAGVWTAALENPDPSAGSGDAAPRQFEGVVTAVFGCFAGLYWLVARVLVASLARHREVVADRGAVALTGNPAALAAASERIEGGHRVDIDLRTARLDAFAITPLSGPGKDWSTGWQTPLECLPAIVCRHLRPALSVHPDTVTRIEALREIEQAT